MTNPIRAALSQPEPAGPSENDLTQLLFDSFRGPIEFICDDEEVAHLMIRSHVKFARAVLARWGRPTPPPQPVPVSERPWEREGWCDEQGRCWALNEHLPAWEFHDCADSRKWADLFLPAHALPLPEEVEG